MSLDQIIAVSIVYVLVGVILSVGHTNNIPSGTSIAYVLFWPFYSLIGLIGSIYAEFKRRK